MPGGVACSGNPESVEVIGSSPGNTDNYQSLFCLHFFVLSRRS